MPASDIDDASSWLAHWLDAVHLVELTDDKGAQLVAASRHPFRLLC